jgi:hypothetical protein
MPDHVPLSDPPKQRAETPEVQQLRQNPAVTVEQGGSIAARAESLE